nr:hypothetical protein [Clostridia bacterium]
MNVHMLTPELLEAVTLFILPGMLIDYIIRIASSREKEVSSVLWRWCGYSLLPSFLAASFCSEGIVRLSLALALAAVMGTLLAWIRQKDFIQLFLCRAFGIAARSSLKTAWEYAFINRPDGYVVVHLKDGKIFRGYYGADSYVSDEYSNLDLFLEQVYVYRENIGWEESETSDGVYISHDSIQAVEFMK